jgi:TPR repeat protein
MGGPKISIFPDSFPAQLEIAYVAARFCGSTESLAIIQDAAEKHHHLAEAYLGVLYDKGCRVLTKSTEKAHIYANRALPWLRTHAAKGDKYAQFHLGFCYDDGRGVEVDDTEAVRWYGMAVAQGLALAQLNLGR